MKTPDEHIIASEAKRSRFSEIASSPPTAAPRNDEQKTTPISQSNAFTFSAEKTPEGKRLGRVETPHGGFDTPVFMPVGTQGTVKTFTPMEIETIGAGIILGNTYHLAVRPGMDIVKKLGGLHTFMGWRGPILTDSGGYQVFSLAKLRKVTDEGAIFNAHFDGREIFFTPENVIEMQEILGSDIMMPFDECPPYTDDYALVKKATERTLHWAERSKARHRKGAQALFGIVQGGHFEDLRRESLARTVELDFEGYALGGLSVGEPNALLHEMVSKITPAMPFDKPRYLMGVGTPLDMLEAVNNGIDMFDCVNPTRYGRTGSAFTHTGMVVVRNGCYSEDPAPIEPGCTCIACERFSRGYIRHLLNTEEILGVRLVSYHNVHFFIHLMAEVRAHLKAGTFGSFLKNFQANYDINKR